MLLIVGLGNPGDTYQNNRHNIGFMAADAIADAHGFGPAKAKFRGVLREGNLAGKGGARKVLLLKPMTYMNESGTSVQEAMAFHKIGLEDVFVIYDELDLAPGRVRVKRDGGNAGHNGLRSISAHAGNAYWRIRLGIGHPGDKARVQGYVLGTFSKDERVWLEPLLKAVAGAAPLLADHDDTGFMNRIALLTATADGKPAPQAGAKAKKEG
ncbi:MAG: aminoacyl-tRNA hydrolase [Alphaproteobacteria bacterium]